MTRPGPGIEVGRGCVQHVLTSSVSAAPALIPQLLSALPVIFKYGRVINVVSLPGPQVGLGFNVLLHHTANIPYL